MKLKKLEMYGFKSFAERIEVRFDEGITGIVGPNGSGKSNIGDAMRWVLGEQNARMLRGNRMEDIIFDGASGHKPLSWCEVALTFDNADGTLPVEYAEVTVLRRVFRNGDSEYYINKKSCRLKDIIDLFRDTGIGRDGYSIIGQGQVSQIIDSRAEDRRSVFHESAGIMKYRVRKEEAERRLANTRDNLERLGDIMSEMESRLEPLRIQSENAKRYLTLSGELKDLEINQFLRSYEESREKIAQWKQQAADSRQESEKAAQALTQAEEKSLELNRQLDELEAALAAAREQAAQTQAEEQRRRGEANLTAERIRNLETEHERLTAEEKQNRERAAQMQAEAETLETALKQAGENAQSAQKQLDEWEAQRAEMADALQKAEDEAERFKIGAMDKMNRLGDIKNAVTRLETMAEAVQQRIAQVESGRGALEEEMAHTRAAGDEIRAQVKTLEEQRTQLQSRCNETVAGLNELRARRHDAMEKTGKLREALQAAQTRQRMLEAMKRDYEGFAEAVRRLLRDSAAGRTENWVQGVVAEVMQVPKELVRAVETALGPAMQNIITSDEQDAKRLIEYLRRNNYGRATFLPISRIQPRTVTPQERAALRSEGCVGVAAELVHTDARYADIISNLLGRTVIARDMDAAIAMARACRNSLRFVTLQGDVINPGGSMSGGSAQSRYTSLLGREAETEELRKRCAAIQGETEAVQQLAEKLDAQVEAGKAAQSALEQQLHDSDLSYTREKERLLKAQQNEQRIAEQIGQTHSDAEQLRENLSDIRSQMDSAQGQQGAEELNQQSVRGEIVRVQQRVNAQRESYQAFVEKINELKIAMASDESHKDSLGQQSRRMRADAQRLVDDAQRKRADSEDALRRLREERRADADSARTAGDYEKTMSGLRQGISALEEQRAQRRQARDENSRAANAQRAIADEMRERAGRLEMQLVRMEADFDNAQNRIWENYELTYANACELRREDFDTAGAGRRIGDIRSEIRKMGTVNVGAVEEYEELGGRYEDYRRQTADLDKAQADLLAIISGLAQKMEERFREQFAKINEYFGATFTELFGGGTAYLVLQDEADILNSGIEIKAQPPGTELKLLSLLSGGEKALTAISLLFAMLRVNPSPFCVLDEIEAALDDANVRRFAQYLRNFTQTTQFVVVTHRKGTMEACNSLYGVTQEQKGISRMLSVKMEDIPEGAAQ
ncbi:MAG: chromosome segregation protein SMC [Eubacteriales bacterium]|nr:chromosome segregation protein SMC [Eubacteriales bacterium]